MDKLKACVQVLCQTPSRPLLRGIPDDNCGKFTAAKAELIELLRPMPARQTLLFLNENLQIFQSSSSDTDFINQMASMKMQHILEEETLDPSVLMVFHNLVPLIKEAPQLAQDFAIKARTLVLSNELNQEELIRGLQVTCKLEDSTEIRKYILSSLETLGTMDNLHFTPIFEAVGPLQHSNGKLKSLVTLIESQETLTDNLVDLIHIMLSVNVFNLVSLSRCFSQLMRTHLSEYKEGSDSLRKLKEIEYLLRLDYPDALARLTADVQKYLEFVADLRYTPPEHGEDSLVSWQLASLASKFNLKTGFFRREIVGPYSLKVADMHSRVVLEEALETPMYFQKVRHLTKLGWKVHQIDNWPGNSQEKRKRVRDLLTS